MHLVFSFAWRTARGGSGSHEALTALSICHSNRRQPAQARLRRLRPDQITRLKGWRLTNCVGRAVGAAVDQVRAERRIKQPMFFSHQNFNLMVRTIIEEMQQEEVQP